jgi:Toxin PAAR-like domain
MFVNGNGPIPGMSLGFPDVCKTPVGPVPVPLPYPNIGLKVMAVPTQFTVFTMCMPSHNMTTVVVLTEGDEPGILCGVVSQLDMATEECEMGSLNLFLGGPPATKLTSPTGHNGIVPNAPGACIVPCQTVFLSLS